MAVSSWILVLVFVGAVQCYPKNKFFEFGERFGDRVLPTGDTAQMDIALNTPLQFYNEQHYYLYVNTDGLLTFNPVRPNTAPYDLGRKITDSQAKLIAPFLVDIDTSESGNIYARHSNSRSVNAVNDIDTASRFVTTFFNSARDFRPTGVSVITWDNVEIFRQETGKYYATFQAIIASDDTRTFAIFLYDYDDSTLPGERAILPYAPFIGFASGVNQNGKWEGVTVGGENDRDVYNALRSTNVNQEGVWAFQIEGTPAGPLYDETEGSGNTGGSNGGNTGTGGSNGGNDGNIGIEVPPGNPYDLDECQSCAFNSTCREYANGYCCVCNPGNYGNGRTCISTAQLSADHHPNHVLNGDVSGTINNIRIRSANMHTWVYLNSGAVYVGISPLPEQIGYTMLSLFPIMELMGWLLAVPSGKGINGFTLTGGEFTSTMRLTFDDGKQLTMESEFFGLDSAGSTTSRTTITGELPEIPVGTQIAVDDHKQVFTRRRNGLVHSYSQKTIKFKDGSNREITYTLDNTIEFDECTGNDADQDPSLDAMRVSFSSFYPDYVPNEQRLRFSVQSKVTPEEERQPDPCVNNNCDPNAQCLPQGTRFTCKCNSGFTGNGYQCRASDPCQNNRCDINAYCYARETTYECVCNEGYAGDGFTCRVEDPCIDNQCDSNANCIPQDTGYSCQCNSGFEGNGFYCEALPIQNSCERNQCDPNAYCIPQQNGYSCQCNSGYDGNGFQCEAQPSNNNCDGHECDPNAYCTPTATSYQCTCNSGFEGNGFICLPVAVDPCDNNNCSPYADCRAIQGGRFVCLCQLGYEGNGVECRPEVDPCTNNACDENAYCTPVRAGYICTCNQFYQGDGYTCTREILGSCDDCDRNAQCIPTTNGFRCVCNAGYNGNGILCQDINECSQGGSVACHPDADCYNTDGSYRCYCPAGFVGDGRTCTEIPRPPSSDAFIMFAQGMNLMRMPLDPNQKGGKIIMRMRQTIVGVSYDCQDEYAYWTDVSSGTINRARYDGSDYQTLVYTGLSSPEGIAVDHLSRNMYWTDSSLDRIEVAKLDGTNRKLLFDTDLVNPRGIAVDPIGGYLYWSDWNRENPKIERSWLDGTNREVITTDVGLPNGLTIDYQSQQLCWADAGTKKIECMNMNGNLDTRYTVFSATEYPFGLTANNYNLYWTDWDSRNIQTINKNGGLSAESLALPRGGNGKVYGVTAVASCPGGTNACASRNGGCSSLCLPTPGNRRMCVCPTSEDGNEIPCVP